MRENQRIQRRACLWLRNLFVSCSPHSKVLTTRPLGSVAVHTSFSPARVAIVSTDPCSTLLAPPAICTFTACSAPHGFARLHSPPRWLVISTSPTLPLEMLLETRKSPTASRSPKEASWFAGQFANTWIFFW